MKTKITILITILLSSTIGFAQKANDYVGHVTLLKRNAQISVSAGTMIPSSNTTSGTNLVNSNVFSINAAKSVFKERGPYKKPPRYIINYINIGASYINGNQDYNIDNLAVYNIQGQTSNPTSSEKGNGSPRNLGFKLETGARVDMHFGNFVVSPVFNVGYLNMKQKGFTVEQTSTLGSTSSSYNLLTQNNSSISGLALIPKLRFTYELSNKIGLWIESNYTFGPNFSTESSRFIPNGSPNQNGQYNIDDMLTGTNVKSTIETKFRAIELNFGLSISLNKGKETKPTVGTLSPGGTTTPPIAVPTTHGLVKPNTSSQWRKHWNNTWCGNGGLYCIRRLDNSIAENSELSIDETINETTVEIKKNNIIITTIAVKGKMSDETLKMFKEQKIQAVETSIPNDLIESLFKTINLKSPKEPVTLLPNNQSYEVVSTTCDGKPVKIIEVTQKTKINIDGKEYNLTIITTSGRGTGSPRSQGF